MEKCVRSVIRMWIQWDHFFVIDSNRELQEMARGKRHDAERRADALLHPYKPSTSPPLSTLPHFSPAELLGVERGRRDDELEVLALASNLTAWCRSVDVWQTMHICVSVKQRAQPKEHVCIRVDGPLTHLLAHPKEHVCVNRPLVRLVQHDGGVSGQKLVQEALAEKHAVRHELNDGIGAGGDGGWERVCGGGKYVSIQSACGCNKVVWTQDA